LLLHPAEPAVAVAMPWGGWRRRAGSAQLAELAEAQRERRVRGEAEGGR